MSISEPFIRRPVGTTLLTVGLTLAGLVAFRQLPISALPQVDYPTIVVSTTFPGASAQTMASSVTAPLERQFGQIPSLAQMTSVSSATSSQITLQFTLDRSIDAAQQDVQAAINAASSVLPANLPAPPTYSKSNPADVPILTLAITSDTLPLPQVNDYADSILAQKISQVSGVGLVTLGGAQRPAVRVQVDPEAVSGTGLTLEDVRTALVAANINAPKGTLDTPRQEYTLQTDDQLMDAKSFAPVVLAFVNGAPLRLRDIAEPVDTVENAQLAGWANEQRAIILNVQRQPGANVIQVADRVKALLPQLEASLPQGIHVSILSDRTETVRASVQDVEFTLVLTIFLVVAVIYVFLRNLRATTIPGITVPLSLIGTFGLMYLLGYSLNTLSLMALTISTGFVVDDAIVMIENISRFIEEGDPPFKAAIKGAGQIGFTIISLTVSLVAVLVPLLFMTGLIGRLFREFAVTLALAIGVSAILSLTLTPMMCAWILKPEPPPDQRGRFYALSERTFERVIAAYGRGVDWVLRHQPLTLAITIGTFLLTVLLAFTIPKGFFPVQDTGLITGLTEADPGVSFARMSQLQQQVVQVVRQDPDVAGVASFIGADGTNPTTNSGRISITLRPRDDRRANATQIIARLQPKLIQVSGIAVYLQAVQDLQIETRQSRTPYQYTLEDADPAELAAWAPKLLAKLRTLPELRNVATDQLGEGPVTL
ncbi:MAG TPA: efflux RND transporter permease subunit, partial [Myxococcaceae bacterium]|nr:efflux RND transporter permease subunit [Myxococcaceae bacterium]